MLAILRRSHIQGHGIHEKLHGPKLLLAQKYPTQLQSRPAHLVRQMLDFGHFPLIIDGNRCGGSALAFVRKELHHFTQSGLELLHLL